MREPDRLRHKYQRALHEYAKKAVSEGREVLRGGDTYPILCIKPDESAARTPQ